MDANGVLASVFDATTGALRISGNGTYAGVPVGAQASVHLLATPASVGAGTWVVGAAGVFYGGFNFNSSNANLDNATWDVFLPAGTYALELFAARNGDGAIVDVDLDGTEIASFDHYNATLAAVRSRQTGIVVASGGDHTLRFRADGHNASSSGYAVRLSAVVFTRTA